MVSYINLITQKYKEYHILLIKYFDKTLGNIFMRNFISNFGSVIDAKITSEIMLYIDFLVANYEVKTILIEPIMGLRNKGNFYGLLKELEIDSRFHFYVLYINGYTSSVDYDGNKKIIKVPNLEMIDKLTYMLTD